MKKFTRILILATILLLQCFLLSGCAALDDFREKQAYITEDRKIVYNDAVFILMPESEYLQPIYNYSEDYQLNVTKSDVPVLLSTFLSEKTLYMCSDGIFLSGYDDTRYDEIVYCREDKYEEMVNRMKEDFNPTKAGYLYETYIEENDEFVFDYYMLSDEEFEAVKEVMRKTNASYLPSDAYIDYNYYIELELCSDDNLFRKYVMDLVQSDNQYYIVYYVDDDTSRVYSVPDSYNEIFSNIMKKGIEAQNSFSYDYEVYEEEVSF